MKHERPIQFTNAEIVDFNPFHQQLRQLSDFLWNDPRPHAEGRFDMRVLGSGFDPAFEDASEALGRCGTAACAAGWADFLFPRPKDADGCPIGPHFWNTTLNQVGDAARNWMFGFEWRTFDNSPYGASFRIDHLLKNRHDLSIYGKVWLPWECRDAIARFYPKDAFWMADAA